VEAPFIQGIAPCVEEEALCAEGKSSFVEALPLHYCFVRKWFSAYHTMRLIGMARGYSTLFERFLASAGHNNYIR